MFLIHRPLVSFFFKFLFSFLAMIPDIMLGCECTILKDWIHSLLGRGWCHLRLFNVKCLCRKCWLTLTVKPKKKLQHGSCEWDQKNKWFAMSHLSLVSGTDVQITQDSLGSDFVIHSLVCGAVVSWSEWGGDKEKMLSGGGKYYRR